MSATETTESAKSVTTTAVETTSDSIGSDEGLALFGVNVNNDTMFALIISVAIIIIYCVVCIGYLFIQKGKRDRLRLEAEYNFRLEKLKSVSVGSNPANKRKINKNGNEFNVKHIKSVSTSRDEQTQGIDDVDTDADNSDNNNDLYNDDGDGDDNELYMDTRGNANSNTIATDPNNPLELELADSSDAEGAICNDTNVNTSGTSNGANTNTATTTATATLPESVENWNEWTEGEVSLWIESKLVEKKKNTDRIESFMNEFNLHDIDGEMIKLFKNKNGQFMEFKNEFNDKSFGIWSVVKQSLDSLPQ